MTKKNFSWWVVLLFSVSSLFTITNITSSPLAEPEIITSNVGSLKGDFSVTPAGQTNYLIPIEVSPGTAGMTPALSLTYNSSNSHVKNGLLGKGFSLAGLTAITRCPSNKTQNGEIHGVDFTDQDRFCLNGDQLVAIKGKYGADKTEYRTYTDSKTKIVSYGRLGNGPAKFKVWTKGGQVAEYGFTSVSRIKAKGINAVTIWGLNRIQDTSSNYLDVDYFQDDVAGSFYPTKINYTGNKRAKVSPYNSVKFIYEERPDVKIAYQAGAKTTVDKRLKTIQTYQGSNLVYEYHLTYELSKNTHHSRMTSVQKCTGSGVCLPPTNFEWQTNEEGWVEAPEFELPDSLFTSDGLQAQLADINGNGLPDFVMHHVGAHDVRTIKTYLNTGYGWKESDFKVPDILHWQGHAAGQLIDLNGNGLLDFVFNEKTSGGLHYIHTYFNTGDGWSEDSSDFHLPTPFHIDHKSQGQFVDLNGNGRPDFVINSYKWEGHRSKNTVETWLNAEDGWQKSEFHLPESIYWGDYLSGVLIDLNGDGLSDFLFSEKVGKLPQYNNAWLNIDDGWRKAHKKYSLPAILHLDHKAQGQFTDLNGDGLPDFIANDGKKVWFNTGREWILSDPKFNLPAALNVGDYPYGTFVDINGSGSQDLVVSNGKDGAVHQQVWINTGNGWQETPAYSLPDVLINKDGVLCGQLVDLNGNGLLDFVQSKPVNGKFEKKVWLNRASKLPDYLIAVTDGFGSKLSIDYKPLTDIDVYTKDSDAKYPSMDWQGAMYVVSKTSSKTCANDLKAGWKDNATNYNYIGAKFNHLGLGFLGFSKFISCNEATGVRTTGFYHRSLPIAVETRLSDGTLISSSEDFWRVKTFGSDSATYYSPYVEKNIKKTFDLKGVLLSTTATSSRFDDYGNPLEIKTVVKEEETLKDYITTTKNVYHNNPDKWFIGELVSSVVTKSKSGGLSQARSSQFSYDPDTSLLMRSVSEPKDPNFTFTTEHTRDLFGNIITTTISGRGIEPRVAKTEYDKYGRFIIRATNALGQSGSQKVDSRLGGIIETTDLNGLKTFFQYDGFGRQVGKIDSDGTKTEVNYSWYDDSITRSEIKSALENVSYVVTTHTQNSTTQKDYYDILGRKVAGTDQSMDGRIIWQLSYLDNLGRGSQKTVPFFAGEAIYSTKMEHDLLGRMVQSTFPDGSSAQIIHDGYTAITRNQLQKEHIKKVNANGNLIKTVDDLGSITTYDYDAYGNMVLVKDSVGNISMLTYDRLGRKVAIDDPDKGEWSYSYDVLGNLVSQKDAMGQVTTFKYDKLNRMISRTDKSGTSIWEYDTAANGVGKLAKVVSLSLKGKGAKEKVEAPTIAIHDGVKEYTKTYIYDDLGRVRKATTAVGIESYTTSYSYDQNSRLDIKTYPNGLQVKNSYNDLGYLVQVSDLKTAQVYWQLNAKDARGNIISEKRSNGLITEYDYAEQTGFLSEIKTKLGSSLSIQKDLFPNLTGVTAEKGKKDNKVICDVNIDGSTCKGVVPTTLVQKEIYDYDVLGNIKSHQDRVNGVTESFYYDDLNRLQAIQSSEMGNKKLLYDELGNIIYKSDVGYYKYGQNGAGPHAVTSISGKSSGRFKYNANGDQIEGVLNGVKRTITYTSYSKPLTITTPEAQTTFYYNADRQKFARVDFIKKTKDDCKEKMCPRRKAVKTYYLDGYELVTIDGGKVVQQKSYIGPNTIHIKTEDKLDSENDGIAVYEMLYNNLGSVTDIVDASGNVVQHFSYSPFGEQKQTKGAILSHPYTYKGFTGHETIKEANLIHMEGRIYDPVLGRFLSADPYIQEPANSQSLNRYSYCINNPLAFVDPSGFFLNGFFDFQWARNFVGGASDVVKSAGRLIVDTGKAIVNSKIGRIAVGVVIGVGLTVASVFCPPLAVVAGAWWQAAIIGGAVTAGLGLGAGVGWKQALLEGAGAFAITAGVSYGFHTIYNGGLSALVSNLTASGGSGSGVVGGIGIPFGGGGDSPSSPPGASFPDRSLPDSTGSANPDNNFGTSNKIPSKMSDRTGPSPVGSTEVSMYNEGNYGNGAGTRSYLELFFDRAGEIALDVGAGAALGGFAGAVVGAELGASGGTLVAPGVGTVTGAVAGAATGAVYGAINGAGAALVLDLSLLYTTPSRAQGKNRRQQGPREIKRIDGPDKQPNSQWHAHGKNGGGVNQDGTVRHRDPGFTKKTLKWLRDHGWK